MAALLFGTNAPAASERHADGGAGTLIADFDASVRTAQGEFFSTFGSNPEAIRDRLVTIGAPARPAWRVEVLEKAGPRDVGLAVPADLSSLTGTVSPADPALTLWMIGELRNRHVSVAIMGKAGNAGGDDSGMIGTIAANQLDASRWQAIRFSVPERLRSSDATIRLELEGRGAAWLAIDKIAMASSPSAAAPTDAGKSKPHEIRQCLWIWNTPRILSSPGETDTLLSFAKRRGFTDLFVQAVYEYHDGAARLGMADRQRALNARAATLGMRVHALDGHPQYVLRENHPRMAALVKALIAFNRESEPTQRYYGLHLDNEPYVRPEWKSPDKRQELIDSYIELNRQVSAAARAGKLEYGVDIPFWWDARDGSDAARFRLGDDNHTPLLEALFPLVDNVGVMSYRPRVLGPNGVIACCETEFDLGRRDGVEVFAAIETGSGPNVEPGISFAPFSREHYEQQLDTLRRIVARTDGAAGVAIHYYDSLRRKLEEAE